MEKKRRKEQEGVEEEKEHSQYQTIKHQEGLKEGGLEVSLNLELPDGLPTNKKIFPLVQLNWSLKTGFM